jgi:hypothetical protein
MASKLSSQGRNPRASFAKYSTIIDRQKVTNDFIDFGYRPCIAVSNRSSFNYATSSIDSLKIGAITLSRQAIVVTRNYRDFGKSPDYQLRMRKICEIGRSARKI